MSTTQHLRRDTQRQPPPGLTWPQILRLAALGLATDLRHRRRDPALRKRPSAQALDPRMHRPIFIIGAPRSGTTFLGSCIGRMPEVSYHFEPKLTKAAAGCVYARSWSERRSAAVFRLSYSALVLVALHGGRRFADKTPENSFIVPFLASTFPLAQFVHIVRDGRDAAVSHVEKPWLTAASAASGRPGLNGQLRVPTPGGGWKKIAAKSSPSSLISSGQPGAGGASPKLPSTGWPRCRAGGRSSCAMSLSCRIRWAQPTC